MTTTSPTESTLAHGDFTGLARNYSQYRPGYAPSVLKAILGLHTKPVREIDFADVGAGTGIWTRLVAQAGVKSATAIEPNDDMRTHGVEDSQGTIIRWQPGSGEATGLPDQSCDLLSMASSFHWVDFDKGTREFHRVLRPGGRFVAIWNPRLIEVSPLLVDIENKLFELAPHIERKSSGRAKFADNLTDKLWDSPYFTDVVYLEGRHVAHLTPEQYLGAWWSVNDIRVQAGEALFKEFMAYAESKVRSLAFVEATYLTRAWTALKQDQAQ